MKKAIVENRKDLVTVRDLFILYGPDITQWPEPKCPGCHRKLEIFGFKNVALAATGRNPPKETHRNPGTANPGFRHFNGEGKDCDYGYKDRGQFDDLTKTTTDRTIKKRVRAEFFLPSNLDRTIAVLHRILGKNYSKDVFDHLVEQLDKRNAWGWDFPAWSAAYIMLEQNIFDFRFQNGRVHRVRFVPSVENGEKVLRMVYSGTSKPLDRYGPYPVSERAANAILAAAKSASQPELDFG
jgi:hypothetical protein